MLFSMFKLTNFRLTNFRCWFRTGRKTGPKIRLFVRVCVLNPGPRTRFDQTARTADWQFVFFSPTVVVCSSWSFFRRGAPATICSRLTRTEVPRGVRRGASTVGRVRCGTGRGTCGGSRRGSQAPRKVHGRSSWSCTRRCVGVSKPFQTGRKARARRMVRFQAHIAPRARSERAHRSHSRALASPERSHSQSARARCTAPERDCVPPAQGAAARPLRAHGALNPAARSARAEARRGALAARTGKDTGAGAGAGGARRSTGGALQSERSHSQSSRAPGARAPVRSTCSVSLRNKA